MPAASSRFCVATVLLLLSVTSAARAEGDGGFSYIPGTPNGPENWGNLKPEWATCSTGKRQSPINLDSLQLTLAPGLGYLNYTYQNAKASVVNHGNEIKVRFDGDAGSLVINHTAYHLRQMHWHTPSEHTIDDRRYDMELHMVHLNAQNEAAVIGILYDVGFRRDKFLYKLEPYIRKIANQKDKEVLVHGGVDPNIAKGPLDNIYYRFMGSFTTPPCTEGSPRLLSRRCALYRSTSLHFSGQPCSTVSRTTRGPFRT
ncbi:hypothetical protein GUJ93_ZPchr0008g13048 [Zizania palustris]|uniref:Carbonic anhydrase n=1 Tax=Zizania palustris TaxID=103762 RepID=A0A8J5UWY1_ZIZPA|nr:hypothetical protein GUJ93_ZPchr0008g13048 [Zizania palustris]